MSYLGNSPGVASQRVVTTLMATEGQTNFVPQSGYTLGYLDVYRNGIKLINGVDYTADNGTDFTLTSGAAADDSIEAVSFTARGLSDGYTKAEADTRFLEDTNSGVTAGSYGSSSQVPVFTVDSRGLITSASETAVAGVSSTSFDSTTGVLTINTSDGGSHTADLGIGTADSPSFSGATINGNLTVADSGGTADVYLTSADTGQSWLHLGGATSNDKGRIGYSDYSDWMRFYTDSVKRMELTSTGLVVEGSVSSTNLGVTNTGNGGLSLSNENGQQWLFANNPGNGNALTVYHYNNGSYDGAKVVVTGTGKLGLNTSTPNDTLDVNGGNIVNPNSTGTEITSATIGLGSNIHLEERQPDGAYSDRTDLAIVTNTGYGLGESEKFRFTAGGFLGINEVTPVNPLHIAVDTANAMAFSTSGNGGGIFLESNSASAADTYGSAINFTRLLAGSNRRKAAIVSKQFSGDGEDVGLSFFTANGDFGSNSNVGEVLQLRGDGNAVFTNAVYSDDYRTSVTQEKAAYLAPLAEASEYLLASVALSGESGAYVDITATINSTGTVSAGSTIHARYSLERTYSGAVTATKLSYTADNGGIRLRTPVINGNAVEFYFITYNNGTTTTPSVRTNVKAINASITMGDGSVTTTSGASNETEGTFIDGSVGIGTSSPGQLLEMYSSGNDSKIRIKSGGTTTTNGIEWVDENGVLQSQFEYLHSGNLHQLQVNGNGFHIYSKQTGSTIAYLGGSSGAGGYTASKFYGDVTVDGRTRLGGSGIYVKQHPESTFYNEINAENGSNIQLVMRRLDGAPCVMMGADTNGELILFDGPDAASAAENVRIGANAAIKTRNANSFSGETYSEIGIKEWYQLTPNYVDIQSTGGGFYYISTTVPSSMTSPVLVFRMPGGYETLARVSLGVSNRTNYPANAQFEYVNADFHWMTYGEGDGDGGSGRLLANHYESIDTTGLDSGGVDYVHTGHSQRGVNNWFWKDGHMYVRFNFSSIQQGHQVFMKLDFLQGANVPLYAIWIE